MIEILKLSVCVEYFENLLTIILEPIFNITGKTFFNK